MSRAVATDAIAKQATYRGIALADAPLAYWRLDELLGLAAADASGNAHGGVLSATGITKGQPSLLAGDPVSRSMLFDGALTSVITTTFIPALVAGAPFSLVAWWTYTDPLTTHGNVVAVNFSDGTGQAFGLGMNSASLTPFARVGLAAGGNAQLNGPNVLRGTIHRSTLTYDGVTLVYYIDGVQVGSSAVATSAAAGAIVISSTTTGLARWMGGMSDLALYGYALTPQQEKNQYLAGSVALGARAMASDALASTPVVKAVGLSLAAAGYWRLDDAGRNYFSNSDFEQDLTGWTEWWPGGNSSIDATVSYTGTKSLKLVGTVNTGSGRYQLITLQPGSYVLSAMAKASADYTQVGNPFPFIENGTGTCVDAGSAGLASITAGMDWTRVGRKFTVTVGGTFRVTLCHSYNGGPATGTVWYDLAQVEVGTVATAWSGTPWSAVVKDISGNGRDGAISGAVAKEIIGAAPGDPNSAGMTFDSTTAPSWISVPDTPALQFAGDFSIVLGLKFAGVPGSYLSILGKYNGSASGYDLGRSANGTLRMTLRGTSQIDTNGLGPVLNDGLWHRVVFVCSLTQVLMYVAGVLVATVPGVWAPVVNNAPFGIGARQAASGAFGGFAGSLKDVLALGRALTPLEISNDNLAWATALAAKATAQEVLV